MRQNRTRAPNPGHSHQTPPSRRTSSRPPRRSSRSSWWIWLQRQSRAVSLPHTLAAAAGARGSQGGSALRRSPSPGGWHPGNLLSRVCPPRGAAHRFPVPRTEPRPSRRVTAAPGTPRPGQRVTSESRCPTLRLQTPSLCGHGQCLSRTPADTGDVNAPHRSAGAAVPEHPEGAARTTRACPPPVPGGSSPRPRRGPGGLSPGLAPGRADPGCSPCPPAVVPPCVCVAVPSSCASPVLGGQGHLRTSCNRKHVCPDPTCASGPLGSPGERASARPFWRDTARRLPSPAPQDGGTETGSFPVPRLILRLRGCDPGTP